MSCERNRRSGDRVAGGVNVNVVNLTPPKRSKRVLPRAGASVNIPPTVLKRLIAGHISATPDVSRDQLEMSWVG